MLASVYNCVRIRVWPYRRWTFVAKTIGGLQYIEWKSVVVVPGLDNSDAVCFLQVGQTCSLTNRRTGRGTHLSQTLQVYLRARYWASELNWKAAA